MSSQTTKIEDLESQKSFQIFVNAIKTEGTRKYYVRDLYAFLEFTKITDFDSLASLSVDDIQDYLESYVLLLRKRGILNRKNYPWGHAQFTNRNGLVKR